MSLQRLNTVWSRTLQYVEVQPLMTCTVRDTTCFLKNFQYPAIG